MKPVGNKGLPEGSSTNNDGSITSEKHEEQSNFVSNQDRTIAPSKFEKAHTSQRKIDANRRNAGKSTGPKTVRGKATVSRNAVNFAFYSKFVVLDGAEDRIEYDELHANLRNYYKPADYLEELWVEKIAVWSWRLRRLMRAESGQIARSLAGHRFGLQQSRTAGLENPELAQPSSSELDNMVDHLFLPAIDDIDKLLRYEAMISRQLNHAMAEVERLQSQRKGTRELENEER